MMGASPGPLPPSDPRRYRFGDVLVDVHARTVLRAGEPQTLEPKAFAVLLELLRRAGELVGRDELLDRVWGHRNVTPGVLTRVIVQLRHALGDDAHQPRYIRTRHALGYCFIGMLLPEDADEPVAAPPPAVVQSAGLAASTGPPDAPAPDPATTRPVAGRPRLVDAGEATPVVPAPVAPRARARAWPALRAWPARWGWLLALALVVGFALSLWSGRRASPGALHDPSVAVAPFTSPAGAGGDPYFAQGLATEMRDALAGVPGLRVVAVPPGRGGGGGGADARALGRRFGVGSVLQASVRREGGRMRVDARLSDARSGATRWSGQFDRAETDVFALQAEIAGEVVQALLGTPPGGALARRLAPTNSVAAYDAYLRGLQHLVAGDGDDGLQRAIVEFQRALEADPGFARAQAGICRAEIVRFEHGLDADAFGRAQAACVRASGMAPDLREVDLALGEMYRARGEHAKAVPHFTRALDDVALRPAAYVGLARVQAALGRPTVARDYFQRALKLSPNDASVHRELGYQAYLDGDLPGAIASFRTATRLAPDDERLWSSLGGLYLAAGDDARAARAFERSLAVRPNYAALSNYGSLRYELRQYGRAAELYRHAAELEPGDFRVWGNIGDALAAQPATAAQARVPYHRAAELAERYVRIRGADDAQALGLLGWYRANLDQEEGARDALARAERSGGEPGEVAFLGAQTLALLGDADGARTRLRKALAADIPERRLDASPLLRPLLPRERDLAAADARTP